MTRLYIYAAGIAAIVAGVWFYGNTQYRAGVRDTVAKFAAADKEGAKNVQETAADTLRSIGDDPDIERLLDSTNGFRD